LLLVLNTPNPALVTQRAAQRLPRLALFLLCAAYVLPGLVGRDPWRSADITAFGYMFNMAQGYTAWLAPTVGGLPADGVLLPYWLGALFIKLLTPWVSPAVAARIPFSLLLVATMALSWRATYFLARTEAAQPLAFAFGGEASPTDYARAIADGALLALVASLGLLQLGHETTPELAQLASVTLFVYALAARPFQTWGPQCAVVVALPALAASGAPSMAMALGLVGTLICHQSSYAVVKRFRLWVLASAATAAAVAWALDAWGWRVNMHQGEITASRAWAYARLLAWFTWPTWPLALWTLWRWRGQWLNRHIAIPLGCVGVAVLSCILMGGSDRALMLGLPPLAVLAAFALPTLQRSTAAAIDWFSVCFFSAGAIAIWLVYASIHTGLPRQPSVNVARLVPGHVPEFSWVALVLAVVGTLAWLWLVKWRIGRNRHALWKSLVLPASGVALCWLLLLTLLLPPLNQARSYRALIERIAPYIPVGACVAAPNMPRAQVVALEYLGRYDVDAITPPQSTRCHYWVQVQTARQQADTIVPPDWRLLTRERRNARDDESTAVYQRKRLVNGVISN
jgi:hypothetical protein